MINAIIFRHGVNDYELWKEFNLTEQEEEKILKILMNHNTDGFSIRGKQKDIMEMLHFEEEIEEVEVCPHCMNENIIHWDVEKDGYETTCRHCGERIMLCSACLHSEDNKVGKCDWTIEGGCFRKHK